VLAERLRDACPALRLLVNCGGGNFKAQLKRADKSGALVALILGDDEVQRAVIGIKALRAEQVQRTTSWSDLIAGLGAMAPAGIDAGIQCIGN
jgi:histidyl-tRNA synthetase